jgi:hypothetical protein
VEGRVFCHLNRWLQERCPDRLYLSKTSECLSGRELYFSL